MVATVLRTTAVTNVASRLAGTPSDFDPSNNTGRATVTGSTIPGLPNTGVPPAASWWPAALAVVIVLGLALPSRRATSVVRALDRRRRPPR